MDGTLNQSGSSAADWSVVASAGPFTLAPGESQTVTFALVGYSPSTEVREALARIVPPKVYIKPISKGAVIDVVSPAEAPLKVDIFSPSGKLLKRLYSGNTDGEVTLRTGKLPSGVYVLRVSTGYRTTFTKFIVR